MFLADYLLKQMSLGYKNSRSKIDYPYELKAKGLKLVQFSKEKNGKFNRYCKKTLKYQKNQSE